MIPIVLILVLIFALSEATRPPHLRNFLDGLVTAIGFIALCAVGVAAFALAAIYIAVSYTLTKILE